MAQLGISLSSFVAAIVSWLERDDRLTSAVYTGQHAPKPDYPYATVSLLSGPSFAGARRSERWEYDDTEDQIVVTYRDQAILSFSLQFFSDDPSIHAMDLAFEALDSLQLQSVRDELETARLAYVSDDGISNLDFEASDRLISRSGLTVTFNTGVSASEQFDTIESVTIEESISDSSDTLIATRETTLP